MGREKTTIGFGMSKAGRLVSAPQVIALVGLLWYHGLIPSLIV
jgi:hypothetical protein